jgi:hypothetical protein
MMNNLDEDLRSVMKRACEQHARTPIQSFEEYRQKKYQELENLMASRKTVYLDMKFWISLRNPDESRNPIKARQLLNLLRTGVREQRLLCPISYAVFLELMKQNPLGKRLAQAQIMDELSGGIGIRNPYDIAEQEFLRFFAKHSPGFKGVPIDPVWTPVGHMIVEAYPQCDLLPQDFMELSRKVMFDIMWATRMEHIATKMDSCPRSPKTTAAKINSERQTHQRGGRPFEKLFADELHGILDEMTSEMDNCFRQAAAFAGIETAGQQMNESDRRVCVNLIREVVTKGLDVTAIPSQRITAALHAALRLDDKYAFKENDLDDIRHSAVAAAYCNAFLTERFFADKLRLPAVRKVISCECKVIDDFDEAISFLS